MIQDSFRRPELEQIRSKGYSFDSNWQVVDIFEKKVAEFFGAPYAVAMDSCTHALELCLRIINKPHELVTIPEYTYMSVPMMLEKLQQPWQFSKHKWELFYYLDPLPVIDAAYFWKKNSYITGTLTVISFQYQKHVPIGRGGIVLTDNSTHYNRLQKLCRDGRDRTVRWIDDTITEIGYHYHMTPEDAARGILLFDCLHDETVALKGWRDYKPLSQFPVFKNKVVI